MGCTWSGLDALVGAVGSGAEVWVNKRRFRIQRQLGEGGFAFVYLVREQLTEQQQWKDAKDPSHVSGALNATLLIFLSLHSCCIFCVGHQNYHNKMLVNDLEQGPEEGYTTFVNFLLEWQSAVAFSSNQLSS